MICPCKDAWAISLEDAKDVAVSLINKNYGFTVDVEISLIVT